MLFDSKPEHSSNAWDSPTINGPTVGAPAIGGPSWSMGTGFPGSTPRLGAGAPDKNSLHQVFSHFADTDTQSNGDGSQGLDGNKKTGGDSDHGSDKKAGSDYPKIVTIASESVNVASAEEEKEAAAIITEIKNTYGVNVSSLQGVSAIKGQYTQVPQNVTSQLKVKSWEMKELRALRQALSHFGPILGKNREQSPLKGTAQEITSVSKVDQAIDRNNATGQLDNSTLGEYFSGAKNFSMFTAGTNSTVDFSDNSKQLEGTAIHEIAHGLLAKEVNSFLLVSGYWVDQSTKSGAADAEAPPTAYGQKNAREDLSESVMFYFVEPTTLGTKCPKRFAFIDKLVKAWQPAKKDNQIGDFPPLKPGPGSEYA